MAKLYTGFRFIICVVGLLSAITAIILVGTVAITTIIVNKLFGLVRGMVIEARNKKNT